MKKNIAIFAALLAFAAGAAAAAPDFRGETIYLALTDRFADGDADNNDIYGDEYRPGDLKYYQGGDFKGLMDNLDYIKGMGFTAIWITPPVMQPPGRYVNSSKTYDAAGYHGYWAWDFSKIDPHLESPGAAYADFIKAAHAKGLKVIQDIVLNHGHGGDTDPASVKWHARRGQLSGLGKTYDYYNDTENWFNHKGPALADLLDLNDQNPAVLDWYVKIYGSYQDMGVDAFRLDTVAWMAPEFWKKFTAAMHKRKKDFFIFGEIWTNDDYKLLGSYTKLAKGDPMNHGMAVVDMPGSSMGGWGRLEKVFKGGSYEDVNELLSHDKAYADPTWLVTFPDNHDKPRFNGAGAGTPATESQYRDMLNYYFTARGIPCVFYGTEAMMPGGDDPDNRRMLGAEGMAAAKAGPIYKLMAELNAVRAASPALQKGAQKALFTAKDQYAFLREYKDSRAYVFLNKGDAPAKIKVPGLKDREYTELTTGVKLRAGGDTEVEVPAHDLRVLAY